MAFPLAAVSATVSSLGLGGRGEGGGGELGTLGLFASVRRGSPQPSGRVQSRSAGKRGRGEGVQCGVLVQVTDTRSQPRIALSWGREAEPAEEGRMARRSSL